LVYNQKKKCSTSIRLNCVSGGSPDLPVKWMLTCAHLLLIPPFARKGMEKNAQRRTAVHVCPLDNFLIISSNLMEGARFGLFLYFPCFNCRPQDK